MLLFRTKSRLLLPYLKLICCLSLINLPLKPQIKNRWCSMVWPFNRKKCPRCESSKVTKTNTTWDESLQVNLIDFTCQNCGNTWIEKKAKTEFFGKIKSKLKRTKKEEKKNGEGNKGDEKGDEGKEKKPSKIGSIIKIIFILLFIAAIAIGVLIFTGTPLGQDIIRQLKLKQFVDWVNHGWCYMTCYLSRIMQTTTSGISDIGTYCDKVVCGAPQVKKEGCQGDDCVNFDLEVLRPTPRVDSDETIRFTLKMDQQAPPAKKVNVALELKDLKDVEVTYEGNKCSSEQSCTMDELSKADTPLAIKAHFTVPCKDVVRYNGMVSYDYETTGLAPVYIKQEDVQTPTNVVPLTTSGPLNFNIEPDQHDYIAGSDKTVGFAISLENKGDGDMIINEITIKQDDYPKEFGPLQLKKCFGAEYQASDNTITITSLGKGYVLASRDIYKIDCTFDIPSGLSSLKEPWQQYILNGDAKYTYTLTQPGRSIFVDIKACQSTSTT